MSIAAAVNLAQDAQQNELRAADDLWNDGNYIAAITAYIRLLNSPAGERYVERIALQTGELFVTEEVTADGRNPRLSSDGRYVSYETGPANALVTRIQRTDGNRPLVTEFAGTNAAFSPDASKVAYIRIPVTDELTEAQKTVEKLAEQSPERTYAQQVLTRLQIRASRIVVRNLASQAETELNTGDLLKQPGIVFGADNETVYFAGASESERRRNDIYAATAATAPTAATDPVVVTDADGFKTAPIVSPSGKTLIVNLPNQTPFPVPQPPAPANNPPGQGQRAQQRGEGNAAQPAQPPPPRFGIVDLATRKITTVTGSAPAFSKDGGVIVYLNSSGADNFLLALPAGGTATTVLKTTSRLAAPTFSLDGNKIAYQRMNREDWEVFVIDADGKNELRVTRDIGHDVLPRFISENRILAASGEPRHRRSFVYDLPSMQQIRLFANTSVRTIAPEYLWMPAPDGSKIFVSADRDGDTISVDRGLYLVDLNRRIDKAKLNERLQKSLTSETLLKEFGQRIFEPIDDHVRRVVAGISESRLYDYEKMLTSFDSRNVSQPGNAKAIEYISETLKSFGYEPEQQWFQLRAALGGKTANVLARLPGTESPEVLYILSAHLDSVAAGPGADDDASGIAALLEAARVLKNNPMPATILFAAFTGEESGTLGSREFARVAKEKKWKIAGGLNNDMIGYANDYRLDNTIRYSNAGIRDIQHSAAMGFSRLITYDARYYRGTDALPLNEAFGEFFGGIGGYPILISPHYHQANDVIETLNFAQIAETAKTTVASLMYLASAPAPVKDLAVKGTEISWSPSPEKNIRSYTVSYGRREERVSQPRMNLTGLKPGDVVMVRATNSRGMQGWDWSRVTVPSR